MVRSSNALRTSFRTALRASIPTERVPETPETEARERQLDAALTRIYDAAFRAGVKRG